MYNEPEKLETEEERARYAAEHLKIMKNPTGSLAREYLRLIAFLEEQEKHEIENA